MEKDPTKDLRDSLMTPKEYRGEYGDGGFYDRYRPDFSNDPRSPANLGNVPLSNAAQESLTKMAYQSATEHREAAVELRDQARKARNVALALAFAGFFLFILNLLGFAFISGSI